MGKLSRLLLVSALTAPLLASTGCVPHRQWGPGEQTYYVQWESQTHRQHEDWNHRDRADQRAYWNWRKHHGDHDHDHNHDRNQQ
jgi:hypothetical protein